MLFPFDKVADAIRAQLRPNMRGALEDFLERAKRWKTSGYDEEMALRLAYYLGDQEQDLLIQLRQHFPKSYERMALHTRRLSRKIVDARAKVFTKASRFAIADASGQELAPEASDTKRWTEIVEACDLLQRLKTLNRWTEALNTVVVAVGYDDRLESPVLRLVAPQFLHVDFDERYPSDLGRAHDAAVEIAGAGGVRRGSEKIEERRFEYWSVGDAASHLIVDGTGRIVEYPGIDGDNPYRDATGPILPLVAFHREAPELGFFCAANGDLVRSNRSVNLTETDKHHIARLQGFGQVYIAKDITGTDSDKGSPPERAFGPDKVVNLRRGETAGVLQTNPALADLEEISTADAKKVATDWDVPAGMILADSRTVASAEALVVDREPQLEAREDQIPLYRRPLARLFEVIRIVNNVHAPAGKRLSETCRLVWHPGDLRVPFSPKDQRDIDDADLALDLTTRATVYARDHGVSLEEARQALEENRAENDGWRGAKEAAAKASGPAIPDVPEDPTAADPKAKPPAPSDAPPPAGTKAATVDALAVDPTTALNGAQVQALVSVVAKVVSGELPRASGIEIIVASFPVTRQQAEAIMGDVGKGFEPTPPAAPAAAPPFLGA